MRLLIDPTPDLFQGHFLFQNGYPVPFPGQKPDNVNPFLLFRNEEEDQIVSDNGKMYSPRLPNSIIKNGLLCRTRFPSLYPPFNIWAGERDNIFPYAERFAKARIPEVYLFEN